MMNDSRALNNLEFNISVPINNLGFFRNLRSVNNPTAANNPTTMNNHGTHKNAVR